MSVSRTIVVVGICAIPLWYAYRTLEEKRVRRLEWSEVFLTEDDRQKKWAEEKQKAKEAAEAERVKREIELEKARAARKLDDMNAANAALEAEKAKQETARVEAEVLRERNAQAEAESRRKADQEQRAAEAAAAKVKSEAERAEQREAQLRALRGCESAAKLAKSSLQELRAEQSSYRAFVDEISKVSLPEPPSQTTISFQIPIASIERVIYGSDYTRTFRMLIAREDLAVGEANSLNEAKRDCDSFAAAGFVGFVGQERPLTRIATLESRYKSAIDGLRRSRSDISDLIDYATGRLAASLGADVRRARVKEIIVRAKSWKESQ